MDFLGCGFKSRRIARFVAQRIEQGATSDQTFVAVFSYELPALAHPVRAVTGKCRLDYMVESPETGQAVQTRRSSQPLVAGMHDGAANAAGTTLGTRRFEPSPASAEKSWLQ
jgi:hypothetical protein